MKALPHMVNTVTLHTLSISLLCNAECRMSKANIKTNLESKYERVLTLFFKSDLGLAIQIESKL